MAKKKEITLDSLTKTLNLAKENLDNAQKSADMAAEKAAAETDEKKKAKLQDAADEAAEEVTQAQKEVDEAQKYVDDFNAEQNANGVWRKKADEYFGYYPNQEELYITSDGTIFLTKNPAENHQRGIDSTKKFETYTKKN